MTDKPHRDALPASGETGSFLERWSRRKRGADQPPAPMEPPAAEPSDEAEALPELTDADMPPLESLDEKADFSGFFSPKVSAGLRRAALRKLFHAPRFNITDGLDDYAEDFTRYQPLGEVVTHEMKRMLEREARRLKERIAETESPGEAPDDTALAGTEPASETEVGAKFHEPGPASPGTESDDETPA